MSPGLGRSPGEGIGCSFQYSWASLVAQMVKNLPAMQETPSSIPGSRNSPGEGIGYPLQYSWASLVTQLVKTWLTKRETCVQSMGWEIPWRRECYPLQYSGRENSMDRGAWQATVHGVSESDTTKQVDDNNENTGDFS